ncbi:MAG: hypothetical protein K2L73_01390 [Muribaculaceae bacterium]|nr:hypothetical protein [Muribaculaceae bacterium]
MMKKTVLSLAVLMTAAIFTSCSSEDFSAPVQTEEGLVTFSVAVPGSIKSRAFADGTTAQNNVTYYIYDQAAPATPVLSGNVPMTDLKGTLTVSLATAHTYDVVFLATSTDAPYSYNEGDRMLNIDYTQVKTSDENLDAFYAVVPDMLVSGPASQSVELYRPFAQLNIGTSDLTAYQAVTHTTVATTAVTVTGVYPQFDLMNEKVAGEAQEVSFAAAALPSGETFPVSYTPAGATEEVPYTYLSMDYLLVNQTKDLVEIALTVTNADGTSDKREYNNIPVQRNFRTNIYGSLLTSSQVFNVEILPGFESPDYNYPVVVTPEAFEAALATGGAVVPESATINTNNIMTGDASTWYEFTTPAELVVNGKLENTVGGQFIIKSDVTISGTGTIESSMRGMLYLQDGGNLNVSGVTINSPAHNRGGGTWITGGDAKFDGVTFNSGYSTINIQPGSVSTVSMTNCVVNNTSSSIYGEWSYALNFSAGDVTLEGTTVNAIHGAIACVKTAKVDIISGSYSANNSAGKDDAFAAVYISGDGVVTIHDGSFYSPRKNYAVLCGDNDANTPFGNAILSGGKYSDKPYDSNTGRGYAIEPQDGYEYEATGDTTYPWAIVKK